MNFEILIHPSWCFHYRHTKLKTTLQNKENPKEYNVFADKIL